QPRERARDGCVLASRHGTRDDRDLRRRGAQRAASRRGVDGSRRPRAPARLRIPPGAGRLHGPTRAGRAHRLRALGRRPLIPAAVHGFPASVAEFLNERFLVPLIREEALPFLVDDLEGALHQRGVTKPGAGFASEDLPHAFLASPLVANTEILGVIVLGKKTP